MLQMNLKKKLKTSYEIRLSSDNRFLCHNMGTKTIVFDFNSGEKIIELNKPKHPGHIRFSNNNEYLLIKSTTGTICIYETSGFQLVKTIQPKKSFKIIEGNVNFAQDNLILDVIQTNNGQQIVAIDIRTGEHTLLTEFENHHTLISYNHYVQKGNFHIFTISYVNNIADYKIVKVKEPINKDSIEIISNLGKLKWDSIGNGIFYDSIHDVYILIKYKHHEIFIVDSDFKKILKKKKII